MKGAFPILERELRIRSRLASLWVIRFAGGSIAMFTALLACLFEAELRGARVPMGLALFILGSGSAALTLLIGAVMMGADSIASEHREGTLGLLLLAPRGAFEVVCSKLACAAVISLSFAAATLPVIAVGVFLGGVRGGDLVLLFPALAALVLFSHSMSLLASSLAVRATSAVGLSIVFIFLPTLAALAWRGLFHAMPPVWLLSVNPFWPLAYTWRSAFPAGFPAVFGGSVLYLMILSIASLCLTAWRVRRLVRHSGRPKVLALHQGCNMSSVVRSSGRQRTLLVFSAPLIWLTVAVAALFLTLHWMKAPFGEARPALLMLGVMACFWAKWRYLMGGAKLLEVERGSRLLELLLTTPAPASLILPPLIRSMRQPLYADSLFATGILFWASVGLGLKDSAAEKSAAWFGFTMILLLWLDFLVLPWVGLWRGLKARTPARALIQAIACGQVAPSLLSIPVFWLLLLADIAYFDEPTPRISWVVGLLAAGIFATCLAGWARVRCFQTFRGSVSGA